MMRTLVRHALAVVLLATMCVACALVSMDGLTGGDAGDAGVAAPPPGNASSGGGVEAGGGDAGSSSGSSSSSSSGSSTGGSGGSSGGSGSSSGSGSGSGSSGGSDGGAEGGAGIAHVQNVTSIGSGMSLTVNLPGAVQAGDLLVGVFRAQDMPSVSDSVNGSWTLINSNTQKYLFYRENTAAAAAGSLLITLTTPDAGDLRICADEFSGVATSTSLDAQSTGSIDGGAAWSAGTTVAIPAGELVYAGGGTGDNEVYAAGSSNGLPMTIGGQQTSMSNGSIFSEYLQSSAAGPQNASANVSPNTVSGLNGGQATFRP